MSTGSIQVFQCKWELLLRYTAVPFTLIRPSSWIFEDIGPLLSVLANAYPPRSHLRAVSSALFRTSPSSKNLSVIESDGN